MVAGPAELKSGSDFFPTAPAGKRRTLLMQPRIRSEEPRTEPWPQTWVCALGSLCFGGPGLGLKKAGGRAGGNSREAADLHVFRCAKTEMLNLLVGRACISPLQD